MIPVVGKEEKVLLLRAEEANEVLPQGLDQAGIEHTDISLYHTVVDMRKADELNRLVESCDYITFASSSAVHAFMQMVEDLDKVKGQYISIGPVTTKTAEKCGLTVAKTATTYTARGIVDTLCLDVEEERE